MAKILIADVIHETGIELIKKMGHEALMFRNYPPPPSQFKELGGIADAIIVRTFPINKDLMNQCPNLRIIGKHGVGVDNIDVDAASKKGIQVVCTPGASSQTVAEHTVTLMLSVAKKITLLDREVRANNYWARDHHRTIEMNNKTLGLVGCGRIGSIVGKICKNGFNMKVFVYDPYLENTSVVGSWGIIVKDITKMLPECDFISIHCPLTSNTKKMINKDMFKLMKGSAILINAARGPIVDYRDMYNALKEKSISGAGLDVFAVEPPVADDPLLSLDNVVLSPHMGACSQEAMQRVVIDIVTSVVTFLNGGVPDGRVN